MVCDGGYKEEVRSTQEEDCVVCNWGCETSSEVFRAASGSIYANEGGTECIVS